MPQINSSRAPPRTGPAQFPSMRGGGRATADFAAYLTAWCPAGATPPTRQTDGSTTASPIAATVPRDSAESGAPASSSPAPRLTGAAFLSDALLSRDDQAGATSTQWGSHIRNASPAGAGPRPPVAYPAIYDAALFASGDWDDAIHDSIQWLAEGASHQSVRHSALASTSSCQYALEAILSESYSTSEELASELGHAMPLEAFHGSLVFLCFHPHAAVALWARQTMQTLVQSAAWASTPEETSTSRELTRLLALWKLALQVLCTVKHLQAVRILFEQAKTAAPTSSGDGETVVATRSRTSMSKERVCAVTRGVYHLLVILTLLDAKLTAATEAVRQSGRAGPNSAPAAVPTTHPTTSLLLGGSLLCYWFLGVFDHWTQEAAGLLRVRSQTSRDEGAVNEEAVDDHEASDPDSDSASLSAPVVRTDHVGQRTMHLMVGFLNEHLQHDTTLAPPCLAVDVKKAVVKVLVHSLLDNARGQPVRKEEADWRLQRMQRLWLFALELDPPTSTVAVRTESTESAGAAGATRSSSNSSNSSSPSVQVPVHNVAQWMFRALLRNAEIQLRFEDAVREAKATPKTHSRHAYASDGTVGPAPHGAATATAAASALPNAVFALYALLTTLEKVAPAGFLGSPFLHDVLLEQERTLFAIVIGGIVQLSSTYAADLYAFLLRADVHYFFPAPDRVDAASSAAGAVPEMGSDKAPTSASALLAATHSRATQVKRKAICLQRCWSSLAPLLKQMVKAESPGEMFTRVLESLTVLVEDPSCCLWLLATADLASTMEPFGWHVKRLLEGVTEILQANVHALQHLWQTTGNSGSSNNNSTHSRASRPGSSDASVVFIAAAASSVRSVSSLAHGRSTVPATMAEAAHGHNARVDTSSDLVAATSRMLAMHPLFPRLIQTLELGEDRALDSTARSLSTVFLSAVNESVRGGFMTDAAAWVFLHAVVPQRVLTGEHFLRLDDPQVNNVARSQGGLWMRVLTRCNWRSLSPLFASVVWWLSALLIDVAALSTEDRHELLEKVVTQLPTLTVASTLPAMARLESREGQELHTPSEPHLPTALPTRAPGSAATRAELSQLVLRAEADVLAGSTDDPPQFVVQALRASSPLHDVLCQLLLSLLKKHTQYRADTFTAAVLYVAGALPARSITADTKFTSALHKVLVPVCEQLQPSDLETWKQYAPTWLAEGLRRAAQTIDECLAEQDRRFAQFEWEEKQLAQASVDEQRRAAHDGAVARQNVAVLQQNAARERANRPAASTTTSGTAMSSLTALALGVKREREEEGDTTEQPLEGSSDGWRRAKQQRDQLEQRVATLLGQTPKPDVQRAVAAPTSHVPPVVGPAAPQRQPTVLQQRLQAVNAQHAQHAQHVQNQGDLESLLRRVAASTNLGLKPPYTGDIIGPGPSCLANEVPVLPSVFTDNATVSGPATGAEARSIQHWAATGRLYANSFAPHIALELRFDIMRAFDEWFDQCRGSGFVQALAPRTVDPRMGMLSTSRALTVADRFPLNSQVEADASAVVLAPSAVSLVDALNPMEVTFTVQAIDLGTSRYRAGTNNNTNGVGGGGGGGGRNKGRFRSGGGGALPLFADFAEGDVVLALLPLSTLLPQWLAFQRARSTSDGVAYTVADQEALLAGISPMWRVLGCLPHVCYVKSLLYGQRTATLATYPAAAPSAGSSGYVPCEAAAAATRISFQHALQVAFKDGSQVAFFLYKLSSLGQAFTSVNALHRVHETHFAQTLYDPRRSAAESQRYFENVHNFCLVKNALPALRARMILQSTLNVWQAQAVLAVLYAATPEWDRTAPLDTSVRGYDTTSTNAIASSPISVANSATAQLFFGGRGPARLPHASPSPSPAAAAAGGSFASLRETALFQGSRIPDVLLIEGPPGTGKTQTIAVLVLNLLLHLPARSRVLLCAPSNCAVDEALMRVQRLQHRLSARHTPLLPTSGSRPLNMTTATKGSLLRVGVRGSVDEAVLRAMPPVFLDDMIDQAMASQETANTRTRGNPYSNADNNANSNNNNNESNSNNSRNLYNRRQTIKERLLKDASVVFSTLGSLNHVQRSGLQFDVVVVDEASQGTEPDVLQALMLAKKRVVLVGDSKQLQPTILCKEAARCGLRRSLLVRLLQNAHHSFLLRTQYRMHPDICAFPNGYFYGAKLRTDQSVLTRIQPPSAASSGSLPDHRRRGTSAAAPSSPSTARSVGQKLGNLPRFVFLNVADGTMMGGRGHSLRNQREAHAIVQHMRQLRSFLRLTVQEFGHHAGIITYYSAQRDTIRQLLSPEERQSGLQIATVDSFQGKEKEIIFISCVRALTREHAQQLERILAARRASHASAGKQEPREDEASAQRGAPPIFHTVGEEDVDGTDLVDGVAASAQEAAQGTHHRATLGFLSDWHRINVSLTRAREMCLVYGHQHTVELAAALAPPRRPAALMAVKTEPLESDDTASAAAAPHDREAILRELEAADEDPQLLAEMIAHARQPNVVTARLAEQERSGRLSIGSLPPDAAALETVKKSPSSVSVIDVDSEDDVEVQPVHASYSSLVPGFAVVGARSRSQEDGVLGSVDPQHRCRAACLVYELHDNLLEILASYRS